MINFRIAEKQPFIKFIEYKNIAYCGMIRKNITEIIVSSFGFVFFVF
jgi:hypothetical protein